MIVGSLVVIRLTLAVVCVVANLTICLVYLINYRHLKCQNNHLLVNMAAADLTLGIANVILTVDMMRREFFISIHECAFILVPTLWGMYLSLLATVPVVHYRVKLIKAYSGVITTNIAEPWKMRANLLTLWICTLVFSILAYFAVVDEHQGDNEGVCLMSLVLNDDYLLPFILFTTNISAIILVEYGKFVQVLTLGVFTCCWPPVHISTVLYIFNRKRTATEAERAGGDIVSLLPLINSTINPFTYTLSEADFLECILRGGHRVLGSVFPHKRPSKPIRIAEPTDQSLPDGTPLDRTQPSFNQQLMDTLTRGGNAAMRGLRLRRIPPEILEDLPPITDYPEDPSQRTPSLPPDPYPRGLSPHPFGLTPSPYSRTPSPRGLPRTPMQPIAPAGGLPRTIPAIVLNGKNGGAASPANIYTMQDRRELHNPNYGRNQHFVFDNYAYEPHESSHI